MNISTKRAKCSLIVSSEACEQKELSVIIQAYTISRDTGQYNPVVRLMPRKSAQTRGLGKLTRNTLWAQHFGGFQAQISAVVVRSISAVFGRSMSAVFGGATIAQPNSASTKRNE